MFVMFVVDCNFLIVDIESYLALASHPSRVRATDQFYIFSYSLLGYVTASQNSYSLVGYATASITSITDVYMSKKIELWFILLIEE